MKKLIYILLLFSFHFSYSQNFNSFNRDPNLNLTGFRNLSGFLLAKKYFYIYL